MIKVIRTFSRSDKISRNRSDFVGFNDEPVGCFVNLRIFALYSC